MPPPIPNSTLNLYRYPILRPGIIKPSPPWPRKPILTLRLWNFQQPPKTVNPNLQTPSYPTKSDPTQSDDPPLTEKNLKFEFHLRRGEI